MDDTTGITDEQREALSIAWKLAEAGVPLFVANADPDSVAGFRLPGRWQDSAPGEASIRQLESWRPGMALCAVGGHAVDFVDVDPRNGGNDAVTMLDAGQWWPRTYGQAATPSGGQHYLIQPLGVGKYQGKGRLSGIDVQGGRPAGHADGTGRGFVFLAPTVRKSKLDGATYAYRWEVPPDLDLLAEWAGADDTGGHLAGLIRGVQELMGETGRSPAGLHAGVGDPFGQPAEQRAFTAEQAREFVGRELTAFRSMRTPEDHGFNAALNDLACVYSHFVPEFVTREAAEAQMYAAAEINRSVEHQGAKGVQATIRSGLDQQSDPWRAVRVPDATPGAGGVQSDAVGVIDPVTALLSRMLTPDDLEKLPNPRPLIQDVLDLDSESWIIGMPGGFKSFVALDMAGHVAAGRPWQGKRVHRGSVVYVVAEGAKGIKLRKQAWEGQYGPMGGQGDGASTVYFLPEPVQVADVAAWTVLVEACRRLEPVLIVLDTQARITVGLEENSATAMGQLVEAIRRLKVVTGACVLVVHHVGRDGGNARGSSALDGAQDTELRVERPAGGQERTELRAAITLDKQKDGDESVKFDIQLQVHELGIDTETGRQLSSLALKPVDGFEQPAAKVDPGTLHASTLVNIMIDLYAEGPGGTQAEIRQHFMLHPTICGLRLNTRKSNWQRAWNRLVMLRRIAKVGTTERFKFLSVQVLENMDRFDGEAPDGLSVWSESDQQWSSYVYAESKKS